MCVSPEKPEPVAASGYRGEPDRMLVSPASLRAGASTASRAAFTLKVWPGGFFRPCRQLHGASGGVGIVKHRAKSISSALHSSDSTT